MRNLLIGGTALAMLALATAFAAPAHAQLLADLVGSATACTANGNPILAEGAPICSAEARVTRDEVRFGAETARSMPAAQAAWRPNLSNRCVNANALPPDPVTYNCSYTAIQDPLYSQCVVEVGIAVGDGGRLVNEAACLLRRPITFQVINPKGSPKIVYKESVAIVECLAYDGVTGADRDPVDDTTLGEPVNVCTIGIGPRLPLSHPLAGVAKNWRVKITQNVTNPVLPGVTSPFTAKLIEALF